MEYTDLVKDFVSRTRANLEFIRNQDKSSDVYEVTQLINSMLGLLVFPQQKYINEIPETPLQELEKEGWPMPKMVGKFPPAPNLRQLIRYLRNAISHFNMRFLSDSNGEISGIKMWNENRGKITWKAELTLEEREGITTKFISIILKEDIRSNKSFNSDGANNAPPS